MNKNFTKYFRYQLVFLILILILFLVLVININSGTVDISIKNILKILFTRSGDVMEYNIIWKIRLPRIIAAAVMGGGLSLAGFLLQTFFSNPIAGPYVLGISSGAKLFVAITLIIALENFNRVSSAFMILSAFIGSLLAMGMVMIIAKKIRGMGMLLVAGIMIGYICSAITEFIITFAQDSDIVNLHNWSQGSFSGTDWGDVAVASAVILITGVIVFGMSKTIGAYQLGEAYAQSMGVNIKIFRVILILLSSILSAAVTAFAGPISFVGIAVPHIMKIALKTAKPLIVIPATFLGGAVFCTVCDLIARVAFSPTELTISTVTAFFGAPVVIVMLVNKRKRG